MGSGKSHWGRLLSEETGMPFFDLDEVIIQSENKSIAEIFGSEGEEYFRYREKEILEQIVEDHATCILSCGGGTPCFFNNIEFMKKAGRVVWLNTDIDTLVDRLLKQKSHRPVIRMVPDAEMKCFIRKKMQERKLYYEQADVIVKEEGLTLPHLRELLFK